MGETRRKTRAELLAEAHLLEQMQGEWTVAHVAAFCTVSESFIYRCDCPRIEKEGVRGIKGKTMPRFNPAEVRAWNATRNKRVA